MRRFLGSARRAFANPILGVLGVGVLSGWPGLAHSAARDPDVLSLTCGGELSAAITRHNADDLQHALDSAESGHIVKLPAGRCAILPFRVPEGVTLAGAGADKTVLVLAPAQKVANSVIGFGNRSTLEQLTLDGNRDHQKIGMCGLFGGGITDASITDVIVTQVLGMGDCFVNALRIRHLRETVTYTRLPSPLSGTAPNGKNGSGFWTASYDGSAGGSSYLDCEAHHNDLDGLEFGSPNITVKGGHYDHNGLFTDIAPKDQASKRHGQFLTPGALGAAGIYFAQDAANHSPPSAVNAVISGVEASDNSESGFDLQPGPGSEIVGNISHDNGTYGFNLHGRTEDVAVTGFHFAQNTAYSNGKTRNVVWAAGNAAIQEFRCGISLTGYVAGATFENNRSFDTKGAAGTQRLGMCVQNDFPYAGKPTFTGNAIVANRFDGNAVAPTNFEKGLPSTMAHSTYSILRR